MGLDMYLNGKKYFLTDWQNPEKNPKEDGFEVKERILRLGYWRKHPNLHGYIVNTFAGGVDECQEIELEEEQIEQTIEAVKSGELPHTTGFFFGASDGSETPEDLKILGEALAWLRDRKDREIRSVVYQASW